MNIINTADSIVLPCQSVVQLWNSDAKGHYFSKINESFIDESGLVKKIILLNKELNPIYLIYHNLDQRI